MGRFVFAGVLLTSIAVLVFGCGGAPEIQMAPGEKLTLSYKVTDGLSYKGKSFQTTNYKGFASDAMTENKFTTSVDSLYPDGVVIRTLKYDEYSMVTYSGGQAIFDDEARTIEGEQLWLKVDPTGEILDWRGLEGIRSFTSEERNRRETMVQSVALSFPTLPQGPVGQGDTWSQIVEMPIDVRQGQLTLKVTNHYCLTGIATKNGIKCAKISMNSEIVGTGEGGDNARAYSFNVDIEGEGKGDVYFGIDEGYVVFSHVETNLQTEHTSIRGREEAKTEFFSAKIESEVVLVE